MKKKIKAKYWDRDKEWRCGEIEIDEDLLKFDPEKDGDEKESVFTLAQEIYEKDKSFFSHFDPTPGNVPDEDLYDWELSCLSDAQAKDWNEALSDGVYVVCDWEKDGDTEGSDVYMKVELFADGRKLKRDDLVSKSRDAGKGGK